jgi:hypothetical protein
VKQSRSAGPAIAASEKPPAGRTGGPESPGHSRVTAAPYGAGMHEQPFASAVDNEQVFVLQWQHSEQVFGLGGRHVGRI